MNICDGCGRLSSVYRILDTDKGQKLYCPACEREPDPVCVGCGEPLSTHSAGGGAGIYAACKRFER